MGRLAFPCPASFLAVAIHLSRAALPRTAAARANRPQIVGPDDSAPVQIVPLRDGSVLNGRIVAAGPPVRYRLSSVSIVELDAATIRDIPMATGRVLDGELWDPDPFVLAMVDFVCAW